MNSEQRKRHLSKVRSATVCDKCEPKAESSEGDVRSCLEIQYGGGNSLSKALSVDVDSAIKAVNLPATCLEGMWSKAADLLHKEHAIVPALVIALKQKWF